MLKHFKNFICSLFNIKACQCEDEHIEYYTKVPEPDVPVHQPCPTHRYFKRKCPMCQAALTQRKNMKPVPEDKKKSLGKLPTAVRNKMGFMAKGGVAKKKKKKKGKK